jgi:integrase
MATITRVKGPTGNIAFCVQVRNAKFKSSARTYRVTGREKDAKAAAKAWGEAQEKMLREQLVRGGARHDLPQLTIAGLIKEYKEDPETQALKSFASDVEPLTDWWINKYGTEKILSFGVLTLHEARRKLHTGKRGPATVNRYLSQMRTTWNWGRATGIIPIDRVWPERGLMLTESAGRTRFLTDEEVPNLLKAAESDPVIRAAIIVSLATGVRQGELLKLTWKDIDLDRGMLTLGVTFDKQHQPDTKNKTARRVHLPSSAVDALKELRKLPIVSPTFPFLNAAGKPLQKSWLETRWYKIRISAGLVDFHWHDLRHSCASFLAQSGATLLEIGSVLGHKSPSMTLRYAHLVQGHAVTGHDKLDAKLRGKTLEIT